MEGPELHSVYKHPKIAKNTSSKLPEGFLHAKTTIVVPKKTQKQRITQAKTQSAEQSEKKQNNNPIEKNNKKQGSRNPFLPIHKFKEQMKKFQQQRKAALQSLHSISMLSLNDNQQQPKIKYQDCITLSVVNRTITTCLKKILHIPTLIVYYLRQSMINMAIQKSEVVQWMNNSGDRKSQKICEMFWNTPEGYYSIIYQYEEGVLLESLLDNVNALPLITIQTIAVQHVKSNINIYNSQLLIDSESKLHYLPIYQQTLPLISSPKLQQILQAEVEENLQRKIMWRLGIVLLVSFLGDCIISSDLITLKASLKSCCLLHALIQMPRSLTKIYLLENNIFQEGQHLISFICRLMSTKNSPTYTKSLNTLRKHKFLTYPYEGQVTLQELTQVIDPFQNAKYMSVEQQQKMVKILDAISLILQNVENSNNLKIDFSKNNKHIQYIAKQVGMLGNVQIIRKSLQSIYKK